MKMRMFIKKTVLSIMGCTLALAGTLVCVDGQCEPRAAAPSQSVEDSEFVGDCTTLIAHGTAVEGGGLIMAKNRDHSYLTQSAAMVQPHQQHQAGEMVRTATISLPQAEETLAFTGCGSSKAFGVSFGINECRVAAACNDANSRDILTYAQGLSDNDVVRLILERAATARAGMELVAQLTETYGQGYHGECYEIGDPGEVWVIETTGKRWAAKRYADTVTARANQFEITDDYDLCSADMVSFAVDMGWAQTDENGRIDFRGAYGGEYLNMPEKIPLAERISSPTLYECEMRVHRCMELLSGARDKKGCVSAADMASFLRDHYDTYTLPSGKVVDVGQIPFYASKYGNLHQYEEVHAQPAGDTQEVPLFIRSICSHRLVSGATTAGGILCASDHTPTNMLLCIGTPCTGMFVPFFPGQAAVEQHYSSAEMARAASAVSLLLEGDYEHSIGTIASYTHNIENLAWSDVSRLSSNADAGALTALSAKWAEKAYRTTLGIHERLWDTYEHYFATHHS